MKKAKFKMQLNKGEQGLIYTPHGVVDIIVLLKSVHVTLDNKDKPIHIKGAVGYGRSL